MIRINNYRIGKKHKPTIVAEIGINHNGSLKRAIQIAKAAIDAGADFIKHQTHVVDDEMSDMAKKIKPGNSNKNIFDIIQNSSLNEEKEFELMKYVKKRGKVYFSTPFSRKAVDRLERFNVPLYKIGSGECNNYPLVEYIAKKKKPVILSTGMNSIKTIKPAVKILRNYKVNYALLHCTNIYPTPNELVRLKCLDELRDNFKDAIIGLSDHSSSIYGCLGAIGRGASIIEKHFVDTKKIRGPDISSSMDINELKELIKGSKIIFESLKGKKRALKEEKKTIAFAFASVAAVKNIKKNEKFTVKNIFPIRPYNGNFKVKDYKNLLGKFATNDIKKGSQIKYRNVKKKN